MLEFLAGGTSDRKLRLFGCACCRSIWDLLVDDRSRNAITSAEALADQLISSTQHEKLRQQFLDYYGREERRYQIYCDAVGFAAADPPRIWRVPHYAAAAVAFHTKGNSTHPKAIAAERAIQASFLRDIFGNPFRPVALDPAWLTSTVVALAKGIYEERAFDRMPILADALQDAGCDYDDLLGHCRGPGPHVRGCWVVDLVLGKS
jgi:hypothetical protein